MAGLPDNLFAVFLNWLYQRGEIYVPTDFHERCGKIKVMEDNDITGLINTILDYSVNSASEAKFKVECTDESVEDLLNEWLNNINININGVPAGLQELSKEYYKERWEGSSLCLLRANNWKKITVGENSIVAPTTLWFVNGSSVYVDRENKDIFKLGTDKYYLDSSKKNKIPATENERIIIQKPFDRWFNEYATPYTIRKGIYKNYVAIEVLQKKSDEVVSKVLPYLFEIIKGSDELFKQGVNYTDKELTEALEIFKKAAESYKTETDKIPTAAITSDTKYEHLIPDLGKILSEELYRQGYRAILSGLGFVDVIQGLASTRRESVLNPAPFIAEVNAGVDGFKSILLELINIIIKENKPTHRKLFSDNNEIKIVNSPIRINVERIMEFIRSGYDRGVVSIESYIESIGFDFDKERERRIKESEDNDENIFYPHLIQNREETGEDIHPAKPKEVKEKNEKENKSPETPESKNFQAEIEEATLVSCKGCGHEFILEDEPEAGMGYVKCPICSEVVTQEDEQAKIEETKNYYRIRQIDPDKFEKDSFKIIWLSKSQGIKAVIGRLKGEKTTTVQSLLFDKKKWTPEKIKEWIKKHEQFHAYIEAIENNLEDVLEIAPYKNVQELLKKHPSMKKYPMGALKVFIEVFNENYPKGEDYAFPVAYTALKRWLKKHGYKKVGDKWVKSEEIN